MSATDPTQPLPSAAQTAPVPTPVTEAAPGRVPFTRQSLLLIGAGVLVGAVISGGVTAVALADHDTHHGPWKHGSVSRQEKGGREDRGPGHQQRRGGHRNDSGPADQQNRKWNQKDRRWNQKDTRGAAEPGPARGMAPQGNAAPSAQPGSTPAR